ncbi:OLC1v1026300C1 [Oldenlandia corymbosa var. corymbosa]|uniref:OLC1v1026300C1 n=1 Tax=Oldenlandia corymbosa var. corymbosa TaxID=529605 RepID=A0AAV1C6T7_OLDCO|nr:OLC1v1026300C1 [Oldenlandia corymbosa var. corymbosa]
MSISQLPEDLLAEVLVRLPRRLLSRFNCVSKSWKDLISCKYFINRHKNSSHHENSKILLLVDKREYSSFYTVELDSLPGNKLRTAKLKLPHPFKTRVKRISGCCNNFLCLCYSENQIVLSNLISRKYWVLPDAIDPSFPELDQGNYGVSYVYGFGYDDINDDYKVVKVACLVRVTVHLILSHEVQIYSLKSNPWRRLPKFSGRLIYKDGKLVNHALHWMTVDGNILALGLKTESYETIPQPKEVSEELESFKKTRVLGVVENCLCVMYAHKSTSLLHLWIMKDYGVQDSWTKVVVKGFPMCSPYGINPFLQPISYSHIQINQIFFHDMEYVYAYDTKNQTLQKAASFKSTTTYIKSSAYPLMLSSSGDSSTLVEPWSCWSNPI